MGIHVRRLARRVVSKEHSHHRGKHKRQEDRHWADLRRPIRKGEMSTEAVSPTTIPTIPPARRVSRLPPETATGYRASWRRRPAEADLACPFGHRHQHDIHDPDAAYDQGYRGDRAEQNRHHLRRRFLSREHLGEVADGEVLVPPAGSCAVRGAAHPSPESPGPWPAGSWPAPSTS